MRRYEDAERMHMKAIMIKEEVFGKKSQEVALSLCHLASLYNYDMGKFREAEMLYLRSIKINLNLFGPTCAGLAYEYRGLINVIIEVSKNHQNTPRNVSGVSGNREPPET